ncbi:hypothetical protein P5673_013311 [Acropora cervicornis]|uniref:Secreted protein n=1 Tax=Acropora cervicornis TaxID=6130 RepID=A0AAD9V779_ACRCE|nr:hypothetical protein P5673_013311 [Acropora cervicornis]
MAKMSFLRSLLVVYLAACLVYESIALAAHSNNGGKKQGLKYRRPERKLALKKLVQGEVLLNPLCIGHKTLMHKKAAQKKELKRRRKVTCGDLFKLH